jgi:ABC-type lipoprotein release transport system permease subunit
MTVGVLIGLALGWLLVLMLGDGIDLSQWAEGVELAGMRSVLVPRLLAADMILVAGLSLFFGILAALYPAWRAVKIKPLEALRR